MTLFNPILQNQIWKMNTNTSERLVLAGERKSGQSVRSENVTAVSAIANIVKVLFLKLKFKLINKL